jgi:hypothetical protein
MDRTEARALLESQLETFRKRNYSELLALMGDVSVLEVVGESGAEYQIEIEVFWDDPGKKANLRVMGAIDDGRLPGALLPLCQSFLVAPDGSFVGE